MTQVTAISVRRTTTIRAALEQLDRAGSGLLLLTRDDGTFERTVTDGDLRRLLLEGKTLDSPLAGLGTIASISLREGFVRQTALELMNTHGINHVPVVNASNVVIRVVDRREIDEQILLSTPHLGKHEREFVEEAFRSNWIAPLGPNVDAFEREVAELAGVGHAAALSSGTAAIHLALCVLGVKRGDTVFCSTLTFAASANPIAYQGAEPVFIDSEPASWNMSPQALERAFEVARAQRRLPRAVIVVNLYGQSADMDPIHAICRQHDVPIIEDAAESLGARYRGRPSGSMGLLGIYSFNGNKIITTSGGGMLVSNDEALIKRARFLSTQARDPAPHYEHTTIGYNYRLSNILAAVGRGQLRVLAERVAARRRVFERYQTGLAGVPAVCWMPEPGWSFSNRWLSVFTLDPAQTRVSSIEVIRALAAEGIEARPVWKPLHLQPVFAECQSFDHDAESFSANAFARGVCLPSGSNLRAAQQDRIIEQLRRILGCA